MIDREDKLGQLETAYAIPALAVGCKPPKAHAPLHPLIQRHSTLLLGLLASLLIASTVWLLGPSSVSAAEALSLVPLSPVQDVTAAPAPAPLDAPSTGNRKHVVPRAEHLASSEGPVHAQHLAAAELAINHTYKSFKGEVERLILSRDIEPLIETALRCEHDACTRFVPRFIREPDVGLRAYLKALEGCIVRSNSMPEGTRTELTLALFDVARSHSSAFRRRVAVATGARIVDRGTLRSMIELLGREDSVGRNAARSAALIGPLDCKLVLFDLALSSAEHRTRGQDPGAWVSSLDGPPIEMTDAVTGSLLETPHSDHLLRSVLRDSLDGRAEAVGEAAKRAALNPRTPSEIRNQLWAALFETNGRDLLSDLDAALASKPHPFIQSKFLGLARRALDSRSDLLGKQRKASYAAAIDTREAAVEADAFR